MCKKQLDLCFCFGISEVSSNKHADFVTVLQENVVGNLQTGPTSLYYAHVERPYYFIKSLIFFNWK